MYSGVDIILKFFDSATILQMIQDERATHIELVPTHIVAMLNLPDVHKYDVSSMKLMWYAASPMPLEVIKKAMKVFGPIFSQGYGQSETGPSISHLSKEDHNILDQTEEEQKKLKSAGHPDIGVHLRIVDEKGTDVKPGEVGEIIVQSKQIMKEYWHKPDDTGKTIVDGW
jgi:acyl-CoA synthetase (AMP-forming)/AMP-acid ligase II